MNLERDGRTASLEVTFTTAVILHAVHDKSWKSKSFFILTSFKPLFLSSSNNEVRNLVCLNEFENPSPFFKFAMKLITSISGNLLVCI